MKRLTLGLAAVAALLALLAGWGWGYLRSQRFQLAMERYTIAQIERGTGARAEIAGFHFQFRPLGFNIDRLVLHGRETAGEPPLAEVRHVMVGLRLVSLLSVEVKLDRLEADEPEVHLFRMADGGSNLPRAPETRPAEPLFDLGIRELRLERGTLVLQDRRLPLDLALSHFGLQLRVAPRSAAPGGPGTLATANYTGTLSFSDSRLGAGALAAAGTGMTLRFTLWPDDLRVDQAAITALGGRLDFSGWLHRLSQPDLDVSYRFTGALPPWLRIAGLDGLRAGDAEASGRLRWAHDDWQATGDFQAVGLRASTANGPTMTASGDFRAAPAGLTLTRLDLAGWGARIQLAGEVAHWRALTLQGRLLDLRLAALWPALRRVHANPRLLAALDRLDGTASGPVRVVADLDSASQSSIDLNLSIAPEAAPGMTPLSGALHVLVQPTQPSADIVAATLSLPATTVSGTGTWARGQLALQVGFDSSNLSDLDPILQAFAAPARFVPLGGAAHLRASLDGPEFSPAISGELTVSHTRVAGFALDQLDAAGTLSPEELRLTRAALSMGLESVQLSGTAGLQDYRLAATSRLDLSLEANNLDLARAQTLAGWRYPLVGVLALQATLTGTPARPGGTARFAVSAARWQRQPIGSVSGHLRFGGGSAEVDDLAVALGPSRMTGNLAVDFDRKTFQVALQAPAIRLADVAVLQSSRLALTGTARISLTGAGPWQAPQATMRISTTGLSGNGETLGAVGAVAQWHGGAMDFQVSDILPEGSLQLDGDVGVSAPYPAHARLVVRDYDFDAWLRRFTAAQVTGHSHIQGEATIDGPLANPRLLRAQASFDPVEAAVSGLVIRNQGPIQLSAADGRLRLQAAHFVAPDTDFTADGTMALEGGGSLDANVNGTINLALLGSLQPNTHASGEVSVAARVAGSATAPQLNGTIVIHDASLSEENLPIGFDHVDGRVIFTGNRAQIDNLTAQTGGGSVAFSGFATRTASGDAYDLSATGSHLRLRYQGVSATGDVKLRMNGTGKQGLVSGEVEMTGMALNDNFDLALFIASSKTRPMLPNPNSLLNRIRLDVHLKTGPEVEVATNAAHLQLQGDLQLRGTAAAPSIVGRVSALEGNVLFGGIQYQVDKGVVQFVNPYRIEPQLDLGLSATVQQYNVSLQISGAVDKLSLSYRSDPPLSSADILALLATGQPTQADAALNQQSTNAFVGPSEQLLGRALDNVVAGRLHRLFGITQIQVNPNTGPTGVAGTGSSVTVQEQVSGDVRLTYTQNLSSSAQDILQVEWTINRFLGIVLNRDSFGLYGLSFELRHRAR